MLSGWGGAAYRKGNCMCSVGGGGGDVRRTIGLCMLERCGVRSRANWGQFQPSSLLALIPQLNWMKDILLPSPRREEGETSGGWRTSVFYLTNMALCSTNCFLYYMDNLMFSSVSPLICLTLVASSPTPFCRSTPIFPANINHDGLYQCFVSLSVLPWLPLFCCFPLQCIQNLNFDPPTTCQTTDSKPGAVHCLHVCGILCVFTCAIWCKSIRVHVNHCACDQKIIT